MHYSRHCKIKGIEHLTSFELMIILSLLLICSGDIELNPGPSTSHVDSESFDESSILNYFSIVHYNIQSISNKVDLIGSELRNFNIICLTETWLSHNTSDDSLKINEFKLYRSDRQADNYGGVCVYILVDGLIWNYRISNVSGWKLIFIIENFFLEHFIDHQILQLKLYRL